MKTTIFDICYNHVLNRTFEYFKYSSYEKINVYIGDVEKYLRTLFNDELIKLVYYDNMVNFYKDFNYLINVENEIRGVNL